MGILQVEERGLATGGLGRAGQGQWHNDGRRKEDVFRSRSLRHRPEACEKWSHWLVEMQVGPGITLGWQEVREEIRSVMKSNVIKDRRIQPWVIAYLGSGRGKKALKEMKTHPHRQPHWSRELHWCLIKRVQCGKLITTMLISN